MRSNLQAVGYAIEFVELPVGLTMEGRMTLCNMAMKGARAVVGVDDVTLEYVHNKPLAPKGAMGPGRGMVANPSV